MLYRNKNYLQRYRIIQRYTPTQRVRKKLTFPKQRHSFPRTYTHITPLLTDLLSIFHILIDRALFCLSHPPMAPPQARDLRARDLSETADPYAKIRLLPDRSTVKQSRIQKQTLNPGKCQREREYTYAVVHPRLCPRKFSN